MEGTEAKVRYLTQKQAEERRMQIRGDIGYELVLDLTETEKGTFRGIVRVEFLCKEDATALFLDYRGLVERVTINSTRYGELQGKQSIDFLPLPKQLLKPAEINTVVVQFRSTFSRDSLGCNRYTDREGFTSIYTATEPYLANQVFPLFDQPDLKGRLLLLTVAPKGWLVNTTDFPQSEAPDINSLRIPTQHADKLLPLQDFIKDIHRKQPITLTLFKRTPKLPTYLFNFIAGQYFCLQSSNTHNNLRVNLYCLHQKQPYLIEQAPLIWELVNYGIQFFEKLFNVPYPFSKCDIVFVHEFAMMAMENPGVLLFDHKYVFERQMNEEMMVDLAETMLHEIAHCWFGNLVTMKWWNDLWLNESFADYMGFYALEKILPKIKSYRYESAMISFFWRKKWGYEEDGIVGYSHPIRGEVESADKVMALFDGITYAKGASVIKNLIYLIGQQNFSKACQQHFSRFAWSNATYQDFMDSLRKYFVSEQFTLAEWQTQWLDNKGFNHLTCKRTGPTQLQIFQSLANSSTMLRWHKLEISLFNEQYEKLRLPVVVSDHSQTTIELPAQASKYTHRLLLNDDDECFVSTDSGFSFDELKLISDSTYKPALTRILIWSEVYESVKGCNHREALVKGVVDNLSSQKRENNVSVLEIVLDFARKCVECERDEAKNQKLEALLFRVLYELLANSELGAQQTNLFSENMLINSSGKVSSEVLLDIFYGRVNLPNMLNTLSIADALLSNRNVTTQEKDLIMKTINEETPESKRSSTSYVELLRTYQLSQMKDQQLTQVYNALYKEDDRTNHQKRRDCQFLTKQHQWYLTVQSDFIRRLHELPANSWSTLFLKTFFKKHLTIDQLAELEGQAKLLAGKCSLGKHVLRLTQQSRKLFAEGDNA